MCILVKLMKECHRLKAGQQAGICKVWQYGKAVLWSQLSQLCWLNNGHSAWNHLILQEHANLQWEVAAAHIAPLWASRLQWEIQCATREAEKLIHLRQDVINASIASKTRNLLNQPGTPWDPINKSFHRLWLPDWNQWESFSTLLSRYSLLRVVAILKETQIQNYALQCQMQSPS